MLDTAEKSKKVLKSLGNFAKGFTLLLTYEVIEELLEEAIAWTITTVAARAISFIVVVVLTQTTKVTVKGLAKGLVILFKPIVKRYTYKEGNDKVDKLRRLYKTMKNAIVKFFAFVARNKKSIAATVTGLLASVGAGVGADGAIVFFDVTLPQYAYYLIAAGVALVMFIPTIIGVSAAGYETEEEANERIAKEDAKKAEKKALKEAEIAEKEHEEALLKLAEQEEAKALEAEAEKAQKAEAEKKAEEEAKKEAERQQEFEQLCRQYQNAKVQDGFAGTLKDFIVQQHNKK